MLAECTSEQAAEIISVIRRINQTLDLRIPRSDILPKLQRTLCLCTYKFICYAQISKNTSNYGMNTISFTGVRA